MTADQDPTDEYRDLARAALAEAAETQDPEARQNLLRFAQMWAEMATANEINILPSPKPDGET